MHGSLVFSVLLQKVDEGLDLRFMDVGLQKLAVVIDEGCHGVLGPDVIANLALHHGEELVGNVFLKTARKENEH